MLLDTFRGCAQPPAPSNPLHDAAFTVVQLKVKDWLGSTVAAELTNEVIEKSPVVGGGGFVRDVEPLPTVTVVDFVSVVPEVSSQTR